MARISGFAPDKLASFECRLVVWIGDGRLQRGTGKAREARELIFSALRYRQRQLGAEIAEEEEWRRRRKFLAHEQERRGGREQDAGDRGAQRARVGDLSNALAERPVANLVMGLQKRDEGVRRAGHRRLPAREGASIARG